MLEYHAGYLPGAIGRIAELHARYYAVNWDFGLFFEAKVATELSDFLLRFDAEKDGFWVLTDGDQVQGSIAIDGSEVSTKGAHLRWFIVAPRFQGMGHGNGLIRRAMDYCQKKAYSRVYLWTFDGLAPARHLYEKHGFGLIEQSPGKGWGKTVIEQKFERLVHAGISP